MSDPKKVFTAYERLKALQGVSRGVDLELARELSYMKADENYKVITGDDESSWRSFLAMPELKLHVAKADRLVKIYDCYIVNMKLKPKDIEGVDSNSLLRLTTVVNKKNVEEWISKARELSRIDLYREIRYGHVEEENCKHVFKCKIICLCDKCGARTAEKVK